MYKNLSLSLKVNPKIGGNFERFGKLRRISRASGVNPAALLHAGRQAKLKFPKPWAVDAAFAKRLPDFRRRAILENQLGRVCTRSEATLNVIYTHYLFKI